MKRGYVISIVVLLLFVSVAPRAIASLTCGTQCVTAADVAAETAANGKCLFIYNGEVYQPPSSTISSRMHQGLHACGTDVTGMMQQSHLNNPNHYLLPYVCAPLCVQSSCADADGDGYTDGTCGGNDCNDHNAQIYPGAQEICGNGLDDNCNSQVDENCAPSQTFTTPVITNTTTVNASIALPAPVICQVNCSQKCGQANGCGGLCPNDELYAFGKCGNPPCPAQCGGAACGQSDSCGGICPSTDKNSCGLCGNTPCCVPEICGDGKDNDCDGVVDNSCHPLSGFFQLLFNSGSNRQNPLQTQSEQNVELTVKTLKSASFITRIGGIAAFFFAGLTLIVGLFRMALINRYTRKKVIRFHTILGCLALSFVIIHVGTVFLDAKGWALLVSINDAFFPHFTTNVITDVAFGVIGLYLFTVTILAGAFFKLISRKLGYKTWLFIHRMSFLFYLFIFIHAFRIGTDFTNPYIIVFFAQGLIVIGYALFFRILKPGEKYFAIKAALQRRAGKRYYVSQIIADQSVADKEIITSGYLARMDEQPASGSSLWYILSDNESKIQASMIANVEPDTYRTINCVVRYYNSTPYIEVIKVRK